MSPVIFGEVLFDCFASGKRVLGGAPFNVAWHLAAFGQTPWMISSVGDDDDGRAIQQRMQQWQLPPAGVQLSPQYPTGTVKVVIEDNEPHYDIVMPSAWDAIGDEMNLPNDIVPFIYHGTLALRSTVSRASFESVQQRINAPLFMDVNLRDPWWQPQQVLGWLQNAAWVKLNAAELSQLLPEIVNESERIQWMLSLPKLRYLLLTKGEAGAILYGSEGNHWAVAPDVNNNAFVDSVGAGDAFTSIFLLGTLLNWPAPIAMQRAQAFASAVVGIRGATTTDRQFYQSFRDEWGV